MCSWCFSTILWPKMDESSPWCSYFFYKTFSNILQTFLPTLLISGRKMLSGFSDISGFFKGFTTEMIKVKRRCVQNWLIRFFDDFDRKYLDLSHTTFLTRILIESMCCCAHFLHGVFHINHIKAEKSGKFPYEKETRSVCTQESSYKKMELKGGTNRLSSKTRNAKMRGKKKRIMELNIHVMMMKEFSTGI